MFQGGSGEEKLWLEKTEVFIISFFQHKKLHSEIGLEWNPFCMQQQAASLFESVISGTARPYLISGQMLSSHSVVSSSRTVRPCSPWGGQ